MRLSRRRRLTHRALVGFFSSVSSHVDNQHVLRLERLLLSTALSPLADERLLVCVDVVVRNVLQIRIFYQKLAKMKIYEGQRAAKGAEIKILAGDTVISHVGRPPDLILPNTA